MVDRAQPEHVDLRQFGWGPTRRVPRVRSVRVSERPPALSLPQYRERVALT